MNEYTWSEILDLKIKYKRDEAVLRLISTIEDYMAETEADGDQQRKVLDALEDIEDELEALNESAQNIKDRIKRYCET